MAYVKKNAAKTVVDEVNTVPEVAVEKEAKIKPKKFQPEDVIPCVSITPGEMFVVGDKSQKLYTFADMEDVVEVEFRDLDYAARRKDPMMYKPRYIIQDKDFLALHPELDAVYSSLHSTSDLKDILKMTPSQMEKIIPTLPLGAQDALKTIAATMVDEGTLDSVNRLKVLDAIFGTEMLLRVS